MYCRKCRRLEPQPAHNFWGTPVCSRCGHKLYACAVCDRQRVHSVILFGDKHPVCADCQREARGGRCQWCELPPIGFLQRWPTCQLCANISVTTEPRLVEVHDYARAQLAELLEMELPLCYTLVLGEGRWESEAEYVDGRILGHWNSTRKRIMVCSGLPDWQCLLTMLHEMTHVWQELNCPQPVPILLEGFACWVQLHVVEKLDAQSDIRDRLLQRPHPVYGEGLRRCLEWEKTVGTAAFLKAIRQASDFPRS